MGSDWLALVISFVYVFGAIGIAEVLRKWRGYSVEFTRKFIHIAVGMWAYGTILLFETRGFAIIPPLAFTIINAISYRYETFKAMETGERSQLGTIYFPISFAAAIWIFWDTPAILVASLMPLTWGDALASVIGRRYGRHPYTIFGSQRSLEGSLTMFAVSWLTTLIPLALIGMPPISFGTALLGSGVAALGATVIEAVSPLGIDNLTIPAITALLLYGILL